MTQRLTGSYGIMLYVGDVERSSAWFCSKLGFTLGPHDFNDFAELHLNGRNVLHLLRSNEPSPMTKPNFALYIQDSKDLHQALKEEGVTVSERVVYSDHAEFLVTDPDGDVMSLVHWF
ncbi:VOC family protein [Paenibacillus soyae]|uniref:VOC family protein n=1 Tax=Paenibacillus soyae TaxID=2969249 RepID=A0A9X2MU62_9BACL|nr:VOC family protein [Paenibacillus soyae]MCR2805846.1 VOC family protein [Paenibacillus soyae]